MKGDWRWQRNKGAAVRDENGRALKGYGSIEDVHEEKILREQLDSEQARLFDAIEQIKDGVMLWDSEQHLIFSNSVASNCLTELGDISKVSSRRLWSCQTIESTRHGASSFYNS